MKKTIIFASCLLLLSLIGCKKQEKLDLPVDYETYTHTDLIPLDENRTDTLKMDIKVDFPTKFTNDTVLATIQRSISTNLFGDDFAEMPIRKAVKAYAEMLEKNYREHNLLVVDEEEDGFLIEEEANPLSEEQILTGQMLGTYGHILMYSIERYIYQGGVHGLTERFFFNYSLLTGNPISQDSIFVPGFEKKLTEILLQNLAENVAGLQLVEDLPASGYEVESVLPNDNFYLSDSLITFVFNPYEIAPSSYGEVAIEVAWTQLQDILQPEYRQE